MCLAEWVEGGCHWEERGPSSVWVSGWACVDDTSWGYGHMHVLCAWQLLISAVMKLCKAA